MMSILYNASEIYEIGIDIEKNGRAFYRLASETETDKDVKHLFEELSEWEAKHIEIFEELKQELKDKTDKKIPYDPEDQYHRYLKAAADSHIFVMDQNVLDLIASCDSPLDVLEMALSFEKDSVVLYTAMKKIVPEHLGRESIDKLINEEISHVSILMERIKAVRQKESN